MRHGCPPSFVIPQPTFNSDVCIDQCAFPLLTELNDHLLNKQIGGELGISEITVKAHQGKVMQKMKAGSLPDLVKMAGDSISLLRRKADTPRKTIE